MKIRRAVAVLLVTLAVPSLWQLRRLEVDNRLERWVGNNQAQAKIYEEFLATFGSDEFVLAVITADDVFSAEVLELALDAAEAAERTPGVVSVQGLPVVFRDLYGGEDPQAVAAEVRATPFYRGLFGSDDLRSLGLLIGVEPIGGARARRTLMTALNEAVTPLRKAGAGVDLVGSTALSAALDEVSEQEAQRAFPLALVGSLIALGLLLRSARATLAAAVCSALTLVLTLGVAVAAGRPLNMITSALPPLLWVLALGNIVHLLTRYQAVSQSTSVADALEQTLAAVRRPCTLAALTTAAGFASLLVAPMQPIRELGGLVAIGVLLSLVVNLCLGPTLLELLRVPPGRTHRRSSGIWKRLRQPRPGLVVGAAVVIVLACLLLLPLIRVESNPLSFLPEHHPTVDAYRSVKGRLGGFYTLEVMAKLHRPFWEPELVTTLDRLAGEIESSPIVTRVLGPLDLVRQLNYWDQGFDPASYRVPDDPAATSRLLSQLGQEGRSVLATLSTPDGRTVRLSAVVDEMDEGQFLELVTAVNRLLFSVKDTVNGVVTGQVLQLVEAQQTLVLTQLKSLGIALALVFACLGIGLASWRLTLLSILPNTLPLVLAFAMMAVLGWPLDASTVMVASVALGIAVDNTAHVLEGFRHRLRTGLSTAQAAAATVQEIGPAMIITTITATVGFVSLVSSSFVPVRYFGLLAAAAMVTALVGDAVLLPALLVLTDKR